MKKPIITVIAVIISFCFGYFFNFIFTKNNKAEKAINQVKDESAGVTGIGGIFFKCKDPEKIKKWYNEHLGLKTDEYGARFEWQEGCDTNNKISLQWSTFNENSDYMKPSDKEFMINYRVNNLKALVDKLKKEKVTILDSIETYEYGKFIHIIDIEGNKIELWEPQNNFKKPVK